MIDDDENLCKDTKELLESENIKTENIIVEYETDFDSGFKNIKKNHYDLIILDVYKGKAGTSNPYKLGKEEVFVKIKQYDFIPIIFYTGIIGDVKDLESEIVKIVRKGDGTDKLIEQITAIINSEFFGIKKKLDNYIRESIRNYLWDFVHDEWDSIKGIKDELSMGYLLMRRLAKSLSKEQIKIILGDSKISSDKIHPMEVYIYPPFKLDEYETGDILKKDNMLYVILTPSCDFVIRNDKRKTDCAILAKCTPLSEFDEFNQCKADKSSKTKKNNLLKIIDSSQTKYYFLPETPFIKNHIVDFQELLTEKYGNLKNYERIARIDDPFVQSMVSSFIRHYNRIGTPDLDYDYIFDHI